MVRLREAAARDPKLRFTNLLHHIDIEQVWVGVYVIDAILGLPIPAIRQFGPAASCALLVEGNSTEMKFGGLEKALAEPDTDLRLFGKPEVAGRRRLGVGLALGDSIDKAREKARNVSNNIQVKL